MFAPKMMFPGLQRCRGNLPSPLPRFSDIGCFKNIRCLFVGRAQFAPSTFDRTRGFPDIGCLADIRCLTVMNTGLGNEIGFGIIISRRGEELLAPTTKHNLQVFLHHPHRRGRPMYQL